MKPTFGTLLTFLLQNNRLYNRRVYLISSSYTNFMNGPSVGMLFAFLGLDSGIFKQSQSRGKDDYRSFHSDQWGM